MPVTEIIKGYDSFTPEVKAQKIVAHLNNELQQRRINPIRFFSMADTHRNDEVTFGQIMICMTKIVPDLSQQFLQEVPMAFGIDNLEQKLTRSDFELLFDSQSSIKLPVVGKKKNRQRATDEERNVILKFLSEACKADEINPEQMFDELDRDLGFKGAVEVSALKDKFKNELIEFAGVINYAKLE